MKTTSRRRILISSLAMLLVALVALGSATFAWFTSSTSAEAKGIAISTTKSSELKVAKLDFQFADSVTYSGFETTYIPGTSADGTTFYTSTATAKTAYTSNGTYAAATDAAVRKTVVYDEMLNIKNVGGKATNATITLSGTINSNFGRLAVVPCATAQSAANSAPAITKANFSANIYGLAANDSWKPYNGSGVESTAYKTKAISGATIDVGSIAPNTVKSYRILVWFEGEDADCYDLTTGALTIGGTAIKFTVTGS